MARQETAQISLALETGGWLAEEVIELPTEAYPAHWYRKGKEGSYHKLNAQAWAERGAPLRIVKDAHEVELEFINHPPTSLSLGNHPSAIEKAEVFTQLFSEYAEKNIIEYQD